MNSVIHSPLFGLLLTLASYRLGQWLYSRSHHHPLLHPLLVAAVPVSTILLLVNLDYEAYLRQTSLLHFLLGPATVALAWPLYRQLRSIRNVWQPVLVTTAVGAVLTVAIALLIAWLLAAPGEVLASLATKSITTPIAIETATLIGGYASLAAGIVAITGITGALAAPPVFRWLRITDDRVRGFTLGLVAHAIGTARAFEYSERAGAFASLALGLTGLLTALVLPWVWQGLP